jgi:hypothetical protein
MAWQERRPGAVDLALTLTSTAPALSVATASPSAELAFF